MNDPEVADPFAHLKQRASERADRTLERIRAAVGALQSTGRTVTAESIKQVTRDLEPGFAGLSFQVTRRNARAYAVYRQAADAFTAKPTPIIRCSSIGWSGTPLIVRPVAASR